MEAKLELSKIAKVLDKEVLKIIDTEIDLSESISPYVTDMLEYASSIASGGKRIRGAFVYYSYLMHGGKNLKEILKVAAAIEISHSYLLIHDDIMDSSPLRRGMKTIHKIYEEIHRENYSKNGSKHFGEGVGITAGDILSHIASGTIITSKFPAENKIKAMTIFHELIKETGYGQLLDEYLELNEDAEEKDIIQVHHYKTGQYTYQNPLFIGAVLAGTTQKNLNTLEKYSLPAGIAFQLQDDILGLFGDEERIGKPADSDLKEGKRTLLIIKALERCNDRDKVIIDNALGSHKITPDTLEAVRRIVIGTGSLDYSEKLAIELTKKAKRALQRGKDPKWIGEGYEFLIGIADYMINRKL